MLIASCSRALRACARSLRVALVAAGLAAVALPAAAVQVTVSGTTYDISFTNTTYNASTVLLQSQPWWGNAALADSIITSYVANGGNTGVDFPVAFLDFAVSFDGTDVTTRYAFQDTGPFPFSWLGTDSANYAVANSVTVAAVPEIDGNALAKALFILFALGAWLHTRRRRLA